MVTVTSVAERLSNVRRGTWLRWAGLAGALLVIFVVYEWWGPDYDEVNSRLEQKYDVDEVSWGQGSKTRSDTLVVDGRDLSGVCGVQGYWGSLDDLEIVCARDVGIGRVEQS